ncbi:MAG: DUF3303 domain-containing protein [Candidatus Aminicenantales bacterium]
MPMMFPIGSCIAQSTGQEKGRVFRLAEADTVPALLAAVHPWADLGEIKTYPVMPVDDVIRLLKSK